MSERQRDADLAAHRRAYCRDPVDLHDMEELASCALDAAHDAAHVWFDRQKVWQKCLRMVDSLTAGHLPE